jgi:hypothetical protein
LLCVLIVALCGVAETMTAAQSSLAALLRIAVATTSLAFLARDYLVWPWLDGRNHAPPLAPV